MPSSFGRSPLARRIPVAKMGKALQLGLCVLVGALSGGILLLDIPVKWRIAFVMALGSATAALLIGNTKRILLFALALVVPFYIGKDVFIVENHVGVESAIGIYLADAILLVLFTLHLARLATRQTHVRLFTRTTVPALAWILASSLSLANARAVEAATLQLLSMGKMLLLYLVVANSIDDASDGNWIIAGLMLGMFSQALLGLYQHATGHPLGLFQLGERAEVYQQELGQTLVSRVQGTLGHPNAFAMYLLTTMPLGLALLLSDNRPVVKTLGGIIFFSGIPSILFSLSRSSWVCFAVICVAVPLLAVRSRKVKLNNALVIGIIVLVVLAAVTLVLSDLILLRLRADDRGSAYSRITRAREAIAVIGDYPLLGVGLNNYALSMPRYDRDATASWRTPPMVHNVYLLVAAETGLLGLAAFAWFLTALGVQGWQFLGLAEGRTLWALAVSSVLAFVALGLHGMVDYDLLGDVGLFQQFWLWAAVVAGFSSRPGYRTNGVKKPREWVHGTSEEVRSGPVNLPVGGGNDALD